MYLTALRSTSAPRSKDYPTHQKTPPRHKNLQQPPPLKLILLEAETVHGMITICLAKARPQLCKLKDVSGPQVGRLSNFTQSVLLTAYQTALEPDEGCFAGASTQPQPVQNTTASILRSCPRYGIDLIDPSIKYLQRGQVCRSSDTLVHRRKDTSPAGILFKK